MVVSLWAGSPARGPARSTFVTASASGTQGWDTGKASRQGPRLDKEADPAALQAPDGPGCGPWPSSCLHCEGPT